MVSMPTDLCSPTDIRDGFEFLSRSASPTDLPGLLSATEPTTSAAALAVDGLVHLTEGWRYFSSALAAALCNSHSQATHFAYYAELRAAVSIFSGFGIRIFNTSHSYLSSSGVISTPQWSGVQTHKVVWDLWTLWCTSPSAESLFLDQLKILPSVTMRDLKKAAVTIAAPPVLRSWAIDLSLSHEKHSRNVASYEARLSREPLKGMTPGDVEFIRQLWLLKEPTGHGLRFEQELARYWVVKQMNSIDPHDRVEWKNLFLKEIERDTGTSRSTLDSFFDDSTPPSPILDSALDGQTGHQNMIARAFFLLRLATLVPNDAFSRFPTTQAKDWLIDWLSNVGLCDKSLGLPPADKWADFEHLGQIQPAQQPLPASLFEVDRASDTHLLCRADAVLAWSCNL
jgi:hypothetical protein